MTRGGKREGAGAKPTWNHGKTKTIRVPIALADEILAVARKLDDNRFLENVTDSKDTQIIDLTGVPLKVISGEVAVMLSGLVNKGYRLYPDKIDDVVNQNTVKKAKYD